MIFYQTWITQLSGYSKQKLAKLDYNALVALGCPKRIRQIHKDSRIMLDSGAFTNANPKAKDKEKVNLEQHIERCHEFAWLGDQATFVQLDVIGDMEQSRKNYHMEIAAGCPVYPVVSCFGQSLQNIYKEVDYYMDFTDYIFVGGLVGTAQHLRYHIIKSLWRRYGYDVRIHLLGVSPNNKDVPEIENFYSTDTARTVIALRTGAPMMMRYNNKWQLTDMPTFLASPPKEAPEFLVEDMKNSPANQARFLMGFYAAHSSSKWYDDNPNHKYDKFIKPGFHVKKKEAPANVFTWQAERLKVVEALEAEKLAKAEAKAQAIVDAREAREAEKAAIKAAKPKPPPSVNPETWFGLKESFEELKALFEPEEATKKLIKDIRRIISPMTEKCRQILGE